MGLLFAPPEINEKSINSLKIANAIKTIIVRFISSSFQFLGFITSFRVYVSRSEKPTSRQLWTVTQQIAGVANTNRFP